MAPFLLGPRTRLATFGVAVLGSALPSFMLYDAFLVSPFQNLHRQPSQQKDDILK